MVKKRGIATNLVDKSQSQGFVCICFCTCCFLVLGKGEWTTNTGGPKYTAFTTSFHTFQFWYWWHFTCLRGKRISYIDEKFFPSEKKETGSNETQNIYASHGLIFTIHMWASYAAKRSFHCNKNGWWDRPLQDPGALIFFQPGFAGGFPASHIWDLHLSCFNKGWRPEAEHCTSRWRSRS